MVQVEINGDDVVIKVMGIHKLWALTSEIHLKKRNIVSVGKTGRELHAPWLFRVGTAFPGLIWAGVLFGWRRKEFWDRTRSGHGICLELTDAAYTRIVVDVRDPDEVIRRLQGLES